MSDLRNDPVARNRHIIISLVRISGVFILLFGMAITVGQLNIASKEVGFLIMLVGFIDMGVAPLLLARRWKSDGGDKRPGDPLE